MRTRNGRIVSSFEIAVGLAGLSVAVTLLPELMTHRLSTVVLLLLLGCAVEFIQVPLGRVTSSLLFALPVGAMMVYGSGAAVWVVWVATIATHFRSQTRWTTTFFNAGQYALSAFAMSLLFDRLIGSSQQGLSWPVFGAGILSALLYLVVNHFLIHLLHLLRQTSNLADMVSAFSIDALYSCLSLPFAFLLVGLSPDGHLFALLSILPLLALGQMLRLQRRTTFLQRIHVTTARLASEFDVDRICQQVAETATALVYADAVALYLFDEGERRLVPNVIHPLQSADGFDLSGIREDDRGVVWEALYRHQWRYVPDTSREQSLRADGTGSPQRFLSLAAFPLVAHDKIRGALVCYTERAYGFGELTGELQVLASQVAVLFENATLYQELQEQSWRDGATGLYNYRYFYEALANRLQMATAVQRDMSVAVVDVDYFKKCNDTYGHLAGDTVLKSLADLLLREAGEDAVVARYGGEEFGLILPCGMQEAWRQAEHIRTAVSRHVIDYEGYKLQGLTVSIGIASYPQHGLTDRDLLSKADSAMYWGAKQLGRNRTARYSPDFDTQLFVDTVTGLYTHHFVTLRTREQLAAGVRNWGAICIDLDQFSRVNNSFGFATGDKVLYEASQVIRDCVRQTELTCRYAGDEFLILLENVSVSELQTIAARIDASLGAHQFACLQHVVLSLRVRAGVRLFADVERVEDMFDGVNRMFAELNTSTGEHLSFA